MSMLWPGFLILLGVIPLIIGLYIWLMRRRRRYAVRYSSLSLVRQALEKQSRWKRHVPLAFFLAALAALIAALARPVTVAAVPTGQTTIILTIDVSRSMCSTDITPSRIEAAEAAALDFIKNQGANRQIGIVAFSTYAEIVQPPTSDQQALRNAIQSLLVGRATAIGSGILKSIDAIATVDKDVVPSVSDPTSSAEPQPVPQGAYAPDIIVVLTDGVSNAGPLPLDAARQAADRGVRVYTIGYGTANPTGFPNCTSTYLGNEQLGNQRFGGGGRGFGGPPGGGGNGGQQAFGRYRRGIDEVTLQQIADLTGGKYYAASSAGELQSVFDNLPTYLIVKHETTEVSVLFAAAGALLAAVAITLALLWNPLP